MAKIAVESKERLARRCLEWRSRPYIGAQAVPGPWMDGFRSHLYQWSARSPVRRATFGLCHRYRRQWRFHTTPLRAGTMLPGSLLLGNVGQHFECAHEHATGDRCIAFGYAPDYFERLVADTGIRAADPLFRTHRVPPLRVLSRLVARACAGLARATDLSWEELGLQLAAQTTRLVAGLPSSSS